MISSKAKRIGLSVVGYVAAWCAGIAAVWWKNRGISLADQTASSGMFAFGDSVTFLTVASLISIAPTIYLFGIIDPASRFWRITSKWSLLVASTALLADLMWILPLGTAPPPLGTFHMLAPLRFFCAPLFLLFFLPGVVQSTGANRKRFLISCAMELLAAGLVVVGFVIHLMRTR